MLSYLHTHVLEEGEVLFRQGAVPDRIYFVVHGYLALVVKKNQGLHQEGSARGSGSSEDDNTSVGFGDNLNSGAEVRLDMGLEYDSEDSMMRTPTKQQQQQSPSFSPSRFSPSAAASSSSNSNNHNKKKKKRGVRIRKLGPGCILGSSAFLMHETSFGYDARSVSPQTVLLTLHHDDMVKLESANPVAAMMLYKETAYFLARKNAQSKRQVNFGLFS